MKVNGFFECFFGSMPEVRSVVNTILRDGHVLVYSIKYVRKYPNSWILKLLRVLKNFWRLHLRFKNHKSRVHWWRLSCLTKRVSIINFCLPQSLFSAIMQNPMGKTHRLVVKGTQSDANFRVGLQKYVNPAPLYYRTASPQTRVGGYKVTQ